MSEGPTRTGSIDAKIGATARELFAVVAEAKAAVKDLTATDPTVKVDANVAEALAKIEAVEAATEKLAVENDTLRASIGRTNDANRASGGYWQTILRVVAAVLPLMGPLAGYMFGVAAAAGVMGAAGIAAIVGIRAEMQAGTTVGQQYSAGLQSLRGDLDALGHTAAVAMLDQFLAAANTIRQAMPALNSDVRVFSTLLGQGGNLLLQTLVKGLQVANPLLITAGVYINQVAAGLLKWTSGGGLATFTQYAIAMLPRVSAALGQLAGMLVHVLDATSPLGTIALGAIQAVSTVINAIPVDVLTAMVGVLGTGYIAFMLYKNVPVVLEAVAAAQATLSTVVSSSLGPLGIIATVIAAIGAAAALTAVQQNTATQAQLDYTAAVEQDNGVVGRNVTRQVARNFAAESSNTVLRKLGITTNDLVKAALQEGDAYEKVTSKLTEHAKKLADSAVAHSIVADRGSAAKRAFDSESASTSELTQNLANNSDAVKTAIKAYNDMQEALGGAKISTRAQLAAQQDLADEYGTSVSAYAGARASQQQTEDQLKQTTLQMRLQNDASGLLREALDLLNGKTLGVAEAQTGMAAANNGVLNSMKDNKTAIDGNSEAAVANQQAIQQAVEASQAYADAKGKETGSSEQARQALVDSKQQLLDTLSAQGLLTDGVRAYIDRIFQIPPVASTKIDADTAAATRKLQELAAQIASFNQQTQVRIDAGIVNAPGQVIRRAGGGSVGDGPSGTVFGSGSSTSDSVRVLLSRGEEVTAASSAGYPGVRPLLKAINYDPAGTMAALAAPTPKTVHNHFPTTFIVQADPSAAYADFQSRQNMRVR